MLHFIIRTSETVVLISKCCNCISGGKLQDEQNGKRRTSRGNFENWRLVWSSFLFMIKSITLCSTGDSMAVDAQKRLIQEWNIWWLAPWHGKKLWEDKCYGGSWWTEIHVPANSSTGLCHYVNVILNTNLQLLNDCTVCYQCIWILLLLFCLHYTLNLLQPSYF